MDKILQHFNIFNSRGLILSFTKKFTFPSRASSAFRYTSINLETIYFTSYGGNFRRQASSRLATLYCTRKSRGSCFVFDYITLYRRFRGNLYPLKNTRGNHATRQTEKLNIPGVRSMKSHHVFFSRRIFRPLHVVLCINSERTNT